MKEFSLSASDSNFDLTSLGCHYHQIHPEENIPTKSHELSVRHSLQHYFSPSHA